MFSHAFFDRFESFRCAKYVYSLYFPSQPYPSLVPHGIILSSLPKLLICETVHKPTAVGEIGEIPHWHTVTVMGK